MAATRLVAPEIGKTSGAPSFLLTVPLKNERGEIHVALADVDQGYHQLHPTQLSSSSPAAKTGDVLLVTVNRMVVCRRWSRHHGGVSAPRRQPR